MAWVSRVGLSHTCQVKVRENYVNKYKELLCVQNFLSFFINMV